MHPNQYEKTQRMIRQLQRELSVFPYPGIDRKQESTTTGTGQPLPPWTYHWKGAVLPDDKMISRMRETARRLGLVLESRHGEGCLEIYLATPSGRILARERFYTRGTETTSTLRIEAQPGTLDFYGLRIELAYTEYERAAGINPPEGHSRIMELSRLGLVARTPRDWLGVLEYMESTIDSLDLEDERIARFLRECWHTARSAIRAETRHPREYVQEIKSLLEESIGRFEVDPHNGSTSRRLYTARRHISNLDVSLDSERKLEYLEWCKKRVREALSGRDDEACEILEGLLAGLEVSIRAGSLLEKTRPIASRLPE